jgi:hypothetical protein
MILIGFKSIFNVLKIFLKKFEYFLFFYILYHVDIKIKFKKIIIKYYFNKFLNKKQILNFEYLYITFFLCFFCGK